MHQLRLGSCMSLVPIWRLLKTHTFLRREESVLQTPARLRLWKKGPLVILSLPLWMAQTGGPCGHHWHAGGEGAWKEGSCPQPLPQARSSPGRRLIWGKDKAECGMRTRGFSYHGIGLSNQWIYIPFITEIAYNTFIMRLWACWNFHSAEGVICWKGQEETQTK